MKTSRFAMLALLIIAAIATWFWFNSPLNSLVKTAIENIGSDMTGAQVKVGKVDLSPTDGKGTLSGLSLGNPQGYKTSHAFKSDHIEVAIEPSSITEDVVLIHKIQIDAPSIIYEKNDSGANFEAIQRNVERYLGDSKPADDKKPAKKMIIESLTIRDIKVNYNGLVDLSLPDIELRNIGKKSGGATSAQVVNAIVAELNAKLVVALAKTAAIGAVGGVAIGVGMGIKSILGK